MNAKGMKMLCRTVGLVLAAVWLFGYFPAAAAEGMGLIHTEETGFLNVYAEPDETSEIVGQAAEEAPAAVLERKEGWLKILTGEIIGWIPEQNLKELPLPDGEEALPDAESAEESTEEGTETEDAAVLTEGEETSETEPEETLEATPEETPEETEEPTGQEETPAAEEIQTVEVGIVPAVEETQPAEAEIAPMAEETRTAEEAQDVVSVPEPAGQEQALLEQAQAQRALILAAAGATEEDLYLMANLIYCEASGEPYAGKVAVGSVVLNRVRSDAQPNTIREVIYARKQFSPVGNGSLARALRAGKADDSCFQAALEALAGARPVGDKLYFRRVNGRSGIVIGRHVFY